MIHTNFSRYLRATAGALTIATLSAWTSAPQASAHPLKYTGTNLAGGEFGGVKPDVAAIYNKDFTYATTAEFDYFKSKGVNIVRIPFHWEVLQPEANKPLSGEELKRFKDVITMATGKGLFVVIDPHNYARYYGKVVGTTDVPASAFADFWGRLASEFRGNSHVWFGLMNEPHDMPSQQWFDAANAAIAAIRKAGAMNMITVPGNNWTGASSWLDGGDQANGVMMLTIKDPANHYVVEAHQYLDRDFSGSHPEVVSQTVGVERLQKFTAWCREHHQHALLGEIGAAGSAEAGAAVTNTLDYMEKNGDVWVGFTWWAAGPWWGDYMFTIEPKDGNDRPQMSYLHPHFQPIKASAK